MSTQAPQNWPERSLGIEPAEESWQWPRTGPAPCYLESGSEGSQILSYGRCKQKQLD